MNFGFLLCEAKYAPKATSVFLRKTSDETLFDPISREIRKILLLVQDGSPLFSRESWGVSHSENVFIPILIFLLVLWSVFSLWWRNWFWKVTILALILDNLTQWENKLIKFKVLIIIIVIISYLHSFCEFIFFHVFFKNIF